VTSSELEPYSTHMESSITECLNIGCKCSYNKAIFKKKCTSRFMEVRLALVS
jgi:hypothetical protein